MRLNKKWSLKFLDMLKCENRSSLHAVQYNGSQALFWCFALFILRMASLDTLFLCSVGEDTWLYC